MNAQRFSMQTNSSTSANYRHRPSVGDFFLDSRFLIVFLPGTALILIFIVIPSIISDVTHIFRPYADVKKNWDTLNLVIVFFAIICGFLARNASDDSGQGTNIGGGTGHGGHGTTVGKTGHDSPGTLMVQAVVAVLDLMVVRGVKAVMGLILGVRRVMAVVELLVVGVVMAVMGLILVVRGILVFQTCILNK